MKTNHTKDNSNQERELKYSMKETAAIAQHGIERPGTPKDTPEVDAGIGEIKGAMALDFAHLDEADWQKVLSYVALLEQNHHHQLQKALSVQAIEIREEEANEYNKIIESEQQKAREEMLNELECRLGETPFQMNGASEWDRGVRFHWRGMKNWIAEKRKAIHSELDQDVTSNLEKRKIGFWGVLKSTLRHSGLQLLTGFLIGSLLF